MYLTAIKLLMGSYPNYEGRCGEVGIAPPPTVRNIEQLFLLMCSQEFFPNAYLYIKSTMSVVKSTMIKSSQTNMYIWAAIWFSQH